MNPWASILSRWRPTPVPSASTAMSYLGTFLTAGLSPGNAWRELALVEPEHAIPHQVVAGVDAGSSVHTSVLECTKDAPIQWRMLGACWCVARTAGAPMGHALGSLATAIRDLDATRREITAALAGPRATMRLIVSLPFVAALGGLLSGGPGLAVLSSPTGFVLVALGVVMIGGALWWLRLLEDGASPDDGFISLELDLFQIATSGGLLPERALALVNQTVLDFNLPAAPEATLADLTALSRRAGVPVGALAGANAALRRERTRIEAHEKVQKLSVHVVLPLGLLVLPAFVLIAVAPMALGLWQGGFA